MTGQESNYSFRWKDPVTMWAMLLVSLVLLVYVSYDGLVAMVRIWENREEYSHGYIIPFITLFLIWQRSDWLSKLKYDGSWAGIIILLFGVAVVFLGLVGAISTIVQYGFVISIIGLLLSLLGKEAMKIVIVPVLILGFMIPLPSFVLQGLSSELQLISSQIGVAIIRLFDISVFLEGNVIDLGVYKLQVVEACSGLNYLFPLMSLAFVTAYFYSAPLWKRSIIFLSSIPVTIFMNSFRIGAIGVLVENWGIEQAEGFLHDFEGWIIFMACLIVLFIEMWVLNKIGGEKRPLNEVFGIELPDPVPEDTEYKSRVMPRSFYAAVSVLVVASIFAFFLGQSKNIVPERSKFTEFPMQLGEWKGRQGSLEQMYIDVLKFDDYIIADYTNAEKKQVNFYSAFYNQQKAGASAHSPRTCIPGGGWEIKTLEPKEVKGVITSNGEPLIVNRLVIQRDSQAQVVYYWFKMRERNVSSEYMVKLYLFWDAVTRNRTDLALVRFTTLTNSDEEIEKADERLQSVISKAYPSLQKFIPE